MLRSILVSAVLVLCVALVISAQPAPAPGQPRAGQAAAQAAADPNAAKRRELQQKIQAFEPELLSLRQRLAAKYSGDLSPAQIEQRIKEIEKQTEPIQKEIDALGPAPAGAGRGGFPGGMGGRGGPAGPVTVPENATPEQLRQLVNQANQTITQLQAASRPQTPSRAGLPAAPKPCEPVNPNATPEARALLKKLCDVTGKGILTGQHNFPNHRNIDTEGVAKAVGKYPAIWGSDFGFTDGEDKDAITHRDLMIEEAKRQHAAGSIIYFCWHMMRPTEDEPGKAAGTEAWRSSVQAPLTEEQWQELISSDSPLHKRWEKYMDTAAVYLKQLQDAKIPVLWRPMHENNGTFFWWGGHPGPYGTALLFREIYNRMTYVHGLNNLVWVWNQNGPAPGGEFYDFFPGAAYCDVVSYDNYRTLDDRYYHEILTIANGKPIGFGELGGPPSIETLKAQPKWTFFMPWSSGTGQTRNAEAWKNPYFLWRGDPIPEKSPLQ
jgi:mannan endo-1,4-beta-mannosidase